MDEKQYANLMDKLDRISNALLSEAIKDMEFKEKVEYLYNTNLTEIEIVKFIHSTRDKVHSVVRKLK
jgi:hypothetical protein